MDNLKKRFNIIRSKEVKINLIKKVWKTSIIKHQRRHLKKSRSLSNSLVTKDTSAKEMKMKLRNNEQKNVTNNTANL